jgi:hypothetical protein
MYTRGIRIRFNWWIPVGCYRVSIVIANTFDLLSAGSVKQSIFLRLLRPLRLNSGFLAIDGIGCLVIC